MFHANGETERQMELTKLQFASRNFVNIPKTL